MGVVGNMRAHIQRGTCLEPGRVHDCAVQDEATPACTAPPSQPYIDGYRQAGRRVSSLADTTSPASQHRLDS